jgi:hypothetical protein
MTNAVCLVASNMPLAQRKALFMDYCKSLLNLNEIKA